MGIADWFNTFCTNIQVKDGATISSRYKTITRRLNTDFWNTSSDTSHSLYVGSYGRNTAIQGFSDLDMIFELPSSVYQQYNNYIGNGQSALLQAVRSSIGKTYPTSKVGADGQIVEISFTGGITFEVVPAFSNNDASFIYPNSNSGGSWKTTNPRPEINAIRTRNTTCNGNLVPLCRMMRSWKSKWSVPIGGLLVDTLAYQFIYNWQHRDKSYLYYDLMCRDFFKFMAAQDRNQAYWKAPGSGQYVYGKGLFQSKADKCHKIVTRRDDPRDSNPEARMVSQTRMEKDLWYLIPKLTRHQTDERFLMRSFESHMVESSIRIRLMRRRLRFS